MKIYKKYTKILLILANIILPVVLFAQNITITNPATKAGSNLIDILTALLNNVVLPIGAVVVVMYIIYAGFTFVTAQGNEKKLGEAKQRLLWALIGGGILLGAVAISELVRNTVSQLITVG
ncbi:MAG: TrbC/VirB2 family protein [Minisyncoccia bacterium]